MKKLFLTILFTLVLSGSALSDNHCNENRKDWIKQLKIDLANDIGDVVYSNDECYAKVIAYNGISMEDHLYRIAGEKRDRFKDPQERKTWELFNELFVDLDIPKDINWVPDSNKDNK